MTFKTPCAIKLPSPTGKNLTPVINRLYIGFDIGDAESVIAFAHSSKNNVAPATMPGKNAAGQAIPTVVGIGKNGSKKFASEVATDYEGLESVQMNFKRRPSDLIEANEARAAELMTIEEDKLLDEPEFQSAPFIEYCERVGTFTDAVLNDEEFMDRAHAFSESCDAITICVGHPTNWNALDRRIYKAILLRSTIGSGTYLDLPVELSIESESRAAFLYIKSMYQVLLAEGEYVVLVDIGSSTIDISVLTKDSRNCVYDSGSNYLGARSIDYLILEYYKETMAKKYPEDSLVLEDLITHNEAAFHSLLLNCRMAKEALFSNTNHEPSTYTRIFFGDMPVVRLTWEALVEDICMKRPIAPVLTKYCGMPASVADELGGKSWTDAFRSFMADQIRDMEAAGIKITKLFTTGSASRMFFIRDICKELIPQLDQSDSLFNDTNPSNAIANGLARVGISSDLAKAFKQDISAFIDPKNGSMVKTIKRRLPDLAARIVDPITASVQNDVVIPAICEWKEGKFTTLQDMMNHINGICGDSEKLTAVLSRNPDFNKAVSFWTANQVGHDIAVDLQGIAHKHNVYDFSIDDLNAFKTLPVNAGHVIGKNDVDVISQLPADVIAYALAAVVGVVAYLLFPYIAGLVVGLIGLLFESLAVAILAFLVANPFTVLIGLAAILALLVGGVLKGYKENKKRINDWLLDKDMPQILRKGINIDKLVADMTSKRAEMKHEIEAALIKPEAQENLTNGIYGSILEQVEERSNQILYEITSR